MITLAAEKSQRNHKAQCSNLKAQRNMTGTARIISAVDGRARSVGSAMARATAFGVRTYGMADAVGLISGTGDRTRQTGLNHWLHVEPEAPQEVVWLDPYGVDYHITTSTGLKWRII